LNAVSPDPILPLTLADLAPLPRWVAWQVETPKGRDKPTKVPYSPAGHGKAHADKPGTWGHRAAAEARAAKLPMPFKVGGIGLELGDLGDGRILAGVDLDTCMDAAGTIAPWAVEVVERFGTYTEVSPSGTGAKVFFLADPAGMPELAPLLTPLGAKQFKQPGDDHPPGIELYTGSRFFAVTGQHLAGTPTDLRLVRQSALLWLLQVAGPALSGAGAADPAADAAIAAQERPPLRKASGTGKDKSRSALAFQKGAKLRRDGASFEAMVQAMRQDPDIAEWVADKGDADNGRELRRIWDKTDPATGELILSGGAPLTSARQFLLRCHTAGSTRTLHHQNGSFYAWQGSHYDELAAEEMRQSLYRFLDGAKRYSDDGELIPFDPTKNKVANVLEATAAEAQLARRIRPPAWLGDGQNPPAAEVIACSNVLLHLPTRDTKAHTPDFFTLNALDFAFDAKAPDPAEWLRFLAGVWPDDQQAIDTLQEVFGLCLTGETKYQKAFLVVGPKRSGKGTIARVLTQLLGAPNVCGPTLSSLSQNFGLAPLIGKRVAIISDARLGGKADQQVIVERLLAITGEDGLTIDRKFRDGWTGKLDARFLILTNEMPRLTDSSGALASRFIILAMVRSFFGKEDLGLGTRLTPELPGILLWAIKGWERLTKRGFFVPPASSDAAQRDLEDLGSPVGAFLRDRCMVGQGHGARCDVMYRAWCDWCQEQGRDHPGNTASFGRDLNAAVAGLRVQNIRDTQGGRQRYYSGVGIDPDWLVERVGTRSNALRAGFDAYHPDDPGPCP